MIQYFLIQLGNAKSRANNTEEGRNAKIFDWLIDNGYISKSYCFVFVEGIPGNETTPVPKIKVYVKIKAETDDIKKYGEDALLEAIKTLDNVKPVLKYDKDGQYLRQKRCFFISQKSSDDHLGG